MKKKFGLILAMTAATSMMAQVASNTPPSLPVPGAPPAPEAVTAAPPATPPPLDTATNKASAKAAKKTVKKKTTDARKTDADKKKAAKAPAPEVMPLILNEPAVSKQSNVNVRAQANINSEVVTHLKRGETVTVLEEITLKHPKTDEPARWAKITLPAGAHVWVNSSFIDSTNQSVVPPKLNVRSGAGENFSVIGMLHKGDMVKSVGTKGDWMEIEAPTNAYAFVAAHLLMHKAPTEPVSPPPVTTTSVVENAPPIAPPPTGTPGTAAVTPPPPPPAIPVVNPVIPPPLAPPTDEPPPKRIVQREGIVGGTVSIQAPSHYELESLDNGSIIDYLYTASTNVVLKKYKGRTVLVTGEEELDERWPNTPVITIQKIQVVE